MKKSFIVTCVTVGSLATMLSTAVYAGKGGWGDGHYGKRENRFFMRLDNNDDGFISLAEHQKMVNRLFDRLDDNGDGVIGKDEQPEKHYHQRKMAKLGLDTNADLSKQKAMESVAQRHKMADTNNDGKLSLAELQKHTKTQRFNRLDSNGDGSISKTEFLNAQRKRDSDR